MALFKIIITAVLLVGASRIECGIVAPAVVPAFSYRQIAPPATLPFAASVSTFTKGLPIYAAPYAAGVLPAPVYPNILPAPAVAAPAIAPGFPAFASAPAFPSPLAYPAPVAPAGFAPAPYVPAPLAAPSPLLPAPFALPAARSVHAVAPGISPGLPAPFLG